ncbi:hypothetical protein [Rhodococcus zopfii]|uniref:hypothetical protein n=1 Tax=Rhodococcus zopfii TaxID=43772 RepID=UPI00093383DE|nr:hypothetical protein [Rhodococcus zopfii]
MTTGFDGGVVTAVEVAVVDAGAVDVTTVGVVVSGLPHADTTIAVANRAAPTTVFTATTPQLPHRALPPKTITTPRSAQRDVAQVGDAAE